MAIQSPRQQNPQLNNQESRTTRKPATTAKLHAESPNAVAAVFDDADDAPATTTTAATTVAAANPTDATTRPTRTGAAAAAQHAVDLCTFGSGSGGC